MITWIGFIISLTCILIISKKNLPLAISSGAVILGLFTLPIAVLFDRFLDTLLSPSVIYLTLSMSIIPLVGGTMKESGQIDSLVNNVRIKQRYLLPFSAALMGLLPMPGGALLSAPILEKGGDGVSNELKAVINNWYRHIFIMIYPLAPALIVAAGIAGLDIYHAIILILPFAVIATILGYVFYLNKVKGGKICSGTFSKSGLIIPLIVILSAPLIDFILKKVFSLGDISTLVGVSTGLALSIIFSSVKLNISKLIKSMKPWNFGLIIFSMFLYLHIFQASDTGTLISRIPLPPLVLSVFGGFGLAVATGRVHLPASIILPIYLSTENYITPLVFTLIYTSIYFGYIISPVHPCLVVTCQYFDVPVKVMMKKLATPTIIMLILVTLITVALL